MRAAVAEGLPPRLAATAPLIAAAFLKLDQKRFALRDPGRFSVTFRHPISTFMLDRPALSARCEA